MTGHFDFPVPQKFPVLLAEMNKVRITKTSIPAKSKLSGFDPTYKL